MTARLREQAAMLCSAMASNEGYWIDIHESLRVPLPARQLAIRSYYSVDGHYLGQRWAEAEAILRSTPKLPRARVI